MNAKLCKRLRRAAERATVGKPHRQIIAILQRSKRMNYTALAAVNDPQSTRGVYLELKRAARRAA